MDLNEFHGHNNTVLVHVHPSASLELKMKRTLLALPEVVNGSRHAATDI